MKVLLSLLLIPTTVMCFCCGGCPASREEVKKQIDKADVLWDNGKRKPSWSTGLSIKTRSRSRRKKTLPHIVEFEVKAGNNDEAKKWIKRGLEDKLTVKYADHATQELFASAKKEYDQAGAEKEHKQQEAKAEAERREAERRKEREKADAEEAARPKPSRENYNKIRVG